MDYEEAEGIRKKSFGSLLADQEGGLGTSLKKSLSLKSKARMTGIKEFFDPMNMAKKLTGGGTLAPALIGKLFKRDQKSMERFAGATKKTVSDSPEQAIEEDENAAIQTLGLIYKELVRTKEDKKLQDELEKNQKESIDKLREDEDARRNKEIIEALKGKKLTRKQKKAERRAERKEEKRKIEEKVTPTPKVEVPKPTTPTTPTTPAKPKEVPKVEAPKVEAPKPKVEAPKVETPTAKPAELPMPKTPTPTAKTETPPAPATTATKVAGKGKGKSIAGTVAAGAGVIGVITAGLVSAGITNEYAQKAVIANVGKETGFEPRNEDLAAYANTSNERIREVFTSRTQKYSDAELNEIKKDPYKFGEMVYGKDTKIGQSMGNTQDGDGFKFRGRGSIQLTGKNNYKAYSDVVKKDLVNNPDLVNQPDIDAAIVAAFVKKGVGKKINDFTDQQSANRAVTQAIGGAKLNLDIGVGAKILSKVEEYSTALDGNTSTGSKVDKISKENKDLKQPSTGTISGGNVNNNVNVTHTTNETAINSDRPDDRSAQEKKRKG